MTVIAWDGTLLAADSVAVCGDQGYALHTKKLHPVFGNKAYAHTGVSAEGLVLIQWHKDGADPESYPDGLVKGQPMDTTLIFVDFAVQNIVTYDGRYPLALPWDKPFAWGAGRGLALGAMLFGADAEEACKIACEGSVYCDEPVITTRAG